MTTWVRATTTAANPPDFDLSHHPAPALAPGVGLGIYNADDNPVDTCTAGWLVHDSTGQAGMRSHRQCVSYKSAVPGARRQGRLRRPGLLPQRRRHRHPGRHHHPCGG
jgi:hypothetical protein